MVLAANNFTFNKNVTYYSFKPGQHKWGSEGLLSQQEITHLNGLSHFQNFLLSSLLFQ